MWTGVSTCGLTPDWMYPSAIYISLGFYNRVGQCKRVSQQQVVVGRRWRVVAKGVVCSEGPTVRSVVVCLIG